MSSLSPTLSPQTATILSLLPALWAHRWLDSTRQSSSWLVSLVSPDIVFSLLYVVTNNRISSRLWKNGVPLRVSATCPSSQLMNTWVVPGFCCSHYHCSKHERADISSVQWLHFLDIFTPLWGAGHVIVLHLIFLQNLHLFFPWWPMYVPTYWVHRALSASDPLQRLLSSVFYVTAILAEVRHYLHVILICISLMNILSHTKWSLLLFILKGI